MDTLTSALFALPFYLFLLVQVLRRRSGHGWLDRLLGFVALLVPTIAVFLSLVSGASTPDGAPLLLGMGIIGIGLGAVMLLLERKRAGYRCVQSRGLLSAGVAILLMATLATTPMITNLVLGGGGLTGDAFAETAMAAAPGESSGAINMSDEELAALSMQEEVVASPTPSPTPQATQPLMPTATFTPYPSATPMPPLPTLVLPTSTPGAIPALATPNAGGSPPTAGSSGAICQVTTGVNLNLRQSPGTDAAILTTIPNGTTLAATETTTDRTWWQVSYDRQVGWVIRDYLYFDAEC